MKLVKYSEISDHEYIGTRLVKVTYSNGVQFILNYNTQAVTLEDGTEIPKMSYQPIMANGKVAALEKGVWVVNE